MVGNSIIRPVIAKLARFRSDPIGSCLHLSSANVSIWAKEHLTTEKEPRGQPSDRGLVTGSSPVFQNDF